MKRRIIVLACFLMVLGSVLIAAAGNPTSVRSNQNQSDVGQSPVKQRIMVQVDKAKVKKAKDEHYKHFSEIGLLMAALQRRGATPDQLKAAVHAVFFAKTSVITKVSKQLLRAKTDVDGALATLQSAPQQSYMTQSIYFRLMKVEVPEGGMNCDSYAQGVYDQCYGDSCILGPRGCDASGCGYIADAASCRCYGGTFEVDIDLCL
ncbi:MAG: hypothetical protein ACREDR_24320 [Blastocatellia bacterium]